MLPAAEADRLPVSIMAPVVMFPSCPATEADRLSVSICQGTIPTVSALSVNFVPEKFVCSNYFSYLCIVPAMPLRYMVCPIAPSTADGQRG